MSPGSENNERMEALTGPPQRRWGDGENVGSRLAVLEAVVSELKESLRQLQVSIATLSAEIRRRPSWTVTTILTLQTTAVGIMATILSIRH